MTVRRRTVWYFHGFDPAATARYRRIFAAASERLGVGIEDLPDGADGWQAVRGDTVTEIRLMRYDDLVRDWRAPPLWRRLVRGAGAFAGLLRDGTLRRLGGRAPRAAALAASPFVALAVPVLLATAGFRAGPVAGAVAVAVAAGAALWLVRRSFLDVVADLFAWMRALARSEAAVAEPYAARIAALAREIAAGGEADEVVVVGHSLGGIAAMLAVAEVVEPVQGSAPARTAASPPDPCAGGPVHRTGPREPAQPSRGDGGAGGATGVRVLSLLTLGSTHGIVLSGRGPGRERLAASVARLAGAVAAGELFWVDVSSPRDAFCVPLTDPLALIADAARQGAGARLASPRVVSARLARAPRIPGDRRTVFRAMRRHMGYLLAPEEGSGFDYAEAVTGTLTLRQRFGARANSPRARMWQP